MRLLKWNGGDVCLVEAPEEPPPYAILSHTWGPKGKEVTFEDVKNGTGNNKPAYAKIRFSGEQAARDGLEYFWIDTCCIDKSSSAELLESLNSMFKWYQDSETCYVYLSDVSATERQPNLGHTQPAWELAFRKSRWFTRGWTLQELVAPTKVAFFSQESEYLGDKQSLGQLIHDITKIPTEVLQGSRPLSKFSTKDRCAWMNGRETTRPEDQAYALLGIVDAYLPLMYGLGKDKVMLELMKAVDEREKAQLSIVEADEFLRRYHYSNKRLRIERLFGDKLEMSKCYINLAIVTQQPEMRLEPSEDGASPFSIFHRLKVDGLASGNHVELSKMFDLRQISQGLTKAPRRILIRGRAGVGKTTLCKKIVFEFEQHNLWRNLFDRVLWVPLRSLKTWTGHSFTVADFFHHHYFQDDRRFGYLLAEHMEREVQLGNQLGTGSRRTLFILDGLDEVSETWNFDEPKHNLLVTLLNQPNVIITSRPHAQLPRDANDLIDLELETVGFYPDQVNEYLEMAIQNPMEVNKVQKFLERFQIVQGLVRIPILLDALCFTWDDGTDTNPALQSMTKFYKHIQEKLMIKDSERLGKAKAPVAINLGALQLEDSLREELDLLEKLAFTGMVNDMIDFEPKTRHAILNAFKGENGKILPDQSIRHLSFLRASDPHKKGADVDYHFLHLTFQEFFAACYFVRQWESDSDNSIHYLDLKNGGGKKKDPASLFLAKHKYDPRYDIFWRFVAGLLDDERNGGEVVNFFRAIDDPKSRDLLGPAHQRLIMHCLNEVSLEMALMQGLEKRLKLWLIFEISCTGSSYLAREMEFPDQILLNVLQENRNDVNKPLTDAVSQRSNLSYKLQQALLDQLTNGNFHVRRAAAGALSSQAGEPKLQQALLNRLADKDHNVRWAAANALRSQAGEPKVQ